jgi:hypothetical protein
MGHLIYGVAPAIRIEDRDLRHLQAVIVTKLRRNESFSFSWDAETIVGEDPAIPEDGHHGTVWISPSASLYFSYDRVQDGPLNMAWLQALSAAASGNSGLRLLPEPTAPRGADRRPAATASAGRPAT